MPVTTDEREQTTPATPPPTEDTAPAPDAPRDQVVEELLVEEISIDGMCGVY